MGLKRTAQRAWLVVTGALALAIGTLALGWLVPSPALASTETPVIESESATNVTATDATLNATINTNGLYTSYEFQIDTNSSYDYAHMGCPLPLPGYAQCMVMIGGPPPPVNEPSPEHIAAKLGAQSVSLDLTSIGATLQPSTTYHYRVIASNTSNGQIVEGPDETFTTAATTSAAPPMSKSGTPTSTTPSAPAKSTDGTGKSANSRSKKHTKTRKHKKPKRHGKKPKRHNA
jgi:hypothetical protein